MNGLEARPMGRSSGWIAPTYKKSRSPKAKLARSISDLAYRGSTPKILLVTHGWNNLQLPIALNVP